jgi:hypothetical protein
METETIAKTEMIAETKTAKSLGERIRVARVRVARLVDVGPEEIACVRQGAGTVVAWARGCSSGSGSFSGSGGRRHRTASSRRRLRRPGVHA